MLNLKLRTAQLKSLWVTLKHFRNPLVIVLTRIGGIKLPYLPYRFGFNGGEILMLGRPTTTSLADLFVIKEVFLWETYRDILPHLGQKPVKLVDVGANLGSFTIWLHRRLGIASAYCFEPEADSFKLLSFNLAHNGCHLAKPINAAAGGWARRVKIQLKQDSPGGTGIYGAAGDSPGVANEIQVLAFAEWLQSVPGEFDLLKLDCEGAEWEILRNCGLETFGRFKVLVAEVHEDPERRQSVMDFKPAMEKLGFRTIRWDGKSQGLYVGIREP